MDAIEKLYKEEAVYGYSIDQDINDAGRVHDWRNYIPEEIKKSWNELTNREKKLLFIVSYQVASAEEWD